MVKKKEIVNWKKWGKRWKKAQKWMGENINPDVLSGHEDRIFGGEEYHDFGFDFNPSKKKRRK